MEKFNYSPNKADKYTEEYFLTNQNPSVLDLENELNGPELTAETEKIIETYMKGGKVPRHENYDETYIPCKPITPFPKLEEYRP